MRPALFSIAMAAFVSVCPADARAQATLGCPCRIRLDSSSSAVSPRVEMMSSPRSTVVSGRFLASIGVTDRGRVVIVEAGQKSQRLLPAGDGPGEVRNPLALAFGPADSLLVFDAARLLASTYDHNGRYVTSWPSPRVQSLLWLGNGSIVATGPLRTEQSFGHDFHVIDRSGRVIRSFGRDSNKTLVSGGTGDHWRRHVIAASEKGQFWSADADYLFRVQRWNDQGRLLTTIAPELRWFPPRLSPRGLDSATEPPAPTMSGLAIDGDVVFALVAVAGPRWRDGLKPFRRTSPEPQGPVMIDNPNVFFDTRILAFDGRSGALLAEEIVDRALGHSGFRNVVLRYDALADGTEFLSTIRLVLESTTRRD
jgi:hypothetical protein